MILELAARPSAPEPGSDRAKKHQYALSQLIQWVVYGYGGELPKRQADLLTWAYADLGLPRHGRAVYRGMGHFRPRDVLALFSGSRLKLKANRVESWSKLPNRAVDFALPDLGNAGLLVSRSKLASGRGTYFDVNELLEAYSMAGPRPYLTEGWLTKNEAYDADLRLERYKSECEIVVKPQCRTCTLKDVELVVVNSESMEELAPVVAGPRASGSTDDLLFYVPTGSKLVPVKNEALEDRMAGFPWKRRPDDAAC